MVIKNLFAISISLLALTVKADPSTASPSVEQGDVKINYLRKTPLTGLWELNIKSNKSQKQCSEYYNFKADKELIIKSNDEWISATYDYSSTHADSVDAGLLIFEIKYDNNEKDCLNQKIDQKGESNSYIVLWRSPTHILFCTGKEENGGCFATLNKVMPQ